MNMQNYANWMGPMKTPESDNKKSPQPQHFAQYSEHKTRFGQNPLTQQTLPRDTT